jgi:hypothetical protein
MVELSERDLVELLGYRAADRHPLEILGYDCSTRGVRRFRAERPDFLPQVCRIIEASLEETGSFPRDRSPELMQSGTYLENRADGSVALFTSVETGLVTTAQIQICFPSVRQACIELIRRTSQPDYLMISAHTQKT